MFDLTSTVVIDRPRSVVYEVLTDFESYLARWAAGPVAAQKITSGAVGVGTKFTVTAQVGPIRVRSPYEVLIWEPQTRFGGRGVAGPVRFMEEYRLDDDSGATRLQQSIRVWPRGPFRIAEAMCRRQLQRLIPADLDRLKALVEAEGEPAHLVTP
jgi:Polyketide cyclase / dehydrase and lipid transport